jgi:hypothetical protein
MQLPSVVDVETAALNAWPGLFTAFDGHWVWRAARDYSNRANHDDPCKPQMPR